MHGAIGNPIFAFWMEGLAFIVLIAVFRNAYWGKISSRALLGGGTALIAVALFPLVKYATGVPACVYSNTVIPLSIFFAPVAIAFSAITVPLGFRAGEWIRLSIDQFGLQIKSSFVRVVASPTIAGLCLVLIVLFRMIVNTDF